VSRSATATTSQTVVLLCAPLVKLYYVLNESASKRSLAQALKAHEKNDSSLSYEAEGNVAGQMTLAALART
jgi:hypothetical protein